MRPILKLGSWNVRIMTTDMYTDIENTRDAKKLPS